MVLPLSEQTAVMSLLVDQVTRCADDVVSLRFIATGATVTGGEAVELPRWTPGAHLDVTLPSGLTRQYSLCGDPEDRTSYTVAVLREHAGRGGSREVHDTALVGRTLVVRGPRNHFALRQAPAYVFIAGGIGITPILAMVRDVSRRGVPWRLYYGGRTASSMAFTAELRALGGDAVVCWPQDDYGLLDVAAIVATADPASEIYCCGPEGLLRAVEEAGLRCAPVRTIRFERFAAASRASLTADLAVAERGGFEVELRRSGITVPVPPDRTILEVVREVLPDVAYSCEDGYCGSCESRVLAGTPEHHDEVLSAEERECGSTMMICVGRSLSPLLVLDL